METVAEYDDRTGRNYRGRAREGLSAASASVDVGAGRALAGLRFKHKMAATSAGWQAAHTLWIDSPKEEPWQS